MIFKTALAVSNIPNFNLNLKENPLYLFIVKFNLNKRRLFHFLFLEQ